MNESNSHYLTASGVFVKNLSSARKTGYVELRASNLYVNQNTPGSEPLEGRLQQKTIVEDSESIMVPFRMLTASLIEGHWLDFTEKGLLESAVEKFQNVTIYTDHYTSITNWVGVAINAKFEKDGINADFKIDTLKAPMIARGLTISPPAIHSCSVGIQFEAEMSHPEFKSYEFFNRLGEEINGEIVRFIVKEIVEVPEVSLVYAGADPRAKRSFRKDMEIEKPTMNIEEKFKKLCEALGIKEDDDLEKRIPELKEKLSRSEKILESTREDTLKTYRAFAGEKAKESMIQLIETANFEVLQGLKNEYESFLGEKYPKNENGIRQTSITDLPPGIEKGELVDFEKYSI